MVALFCGLLAVMMGLLWTCLGDYFVSVLCGLIVGCLLWLGVASRFVRLFTCFRLWV